MTERIINTTELREDIKYVESDRDLLAVDYEADYLAQEATDRLEFAIVEAKAVLAAINAVNRQS